MCAIIFNLKPKEVVMLVLTRHIDEKIIIGDNIIVSVLGVQGNHVRLGFTAPKNVSVHREEIYQRIQQGQTEEEVVK